MWGGALVPGQWAAPGVPSHPWGRTRIKRVLYLASLAVSRSKVGLGACYDRLRKRGKPGKVALVAIMRKLLLQLNAVARRGTPWQPDRQPVVLK